MIYFGNTPNGINRSFALAPLYIHNFVIVDRMKKSKTVHFSIYMSCEAERKEIEISESDKLLREWWKMQNFVQQKGLR